MAHLARLAAGAARSGVLLRNCWFGSGDFQNGAPVRPRQQAGARITSVVRVVVGAAIASVVMGSPLVAVWSREATFTVPQNPIKPACNGTTSWLPVWGAYF